MAEYVMAEGDTAADVARALLDRAESPDDVHWSPRPDVPGGGVFVVRDEAVVADVAHELAQAREERERAADEGEPEPVPAGPTEEGVDTSAALDVTPPAAGENAAETVESEDDEPATDDPDTPEDESKMTPAQRRAARRAKAAADSKTE